MGSLNVAQVRMDEMRGVKGVVAFTDYMQGHEVKPINVSGAFYYNNDLSSGANICDSLPTPYTKGDCYARFDTGRVVPTGAATAPRRFGVLACAYMGIPAL